MIVFIMEKKYLDIQFKRKSPPAILISMRLSL